MKKIGILTYHNTTNYGALLQAFALQSKLKELGADSEIINYHCKSIEERENITFPKFEKNLLNYLRKIKRYYGVSKKRKLMNKFINNNVLISNEQYDRKNIKDSNNKYDKFVVGSDMVFELGINGGDMTYYLDFAEEEKRYSYAASLGVDKIDDKYLDMCKKELEKFRHLSVRENRAKEYFSKILKNEVYVDIDPTLLYGGDFWKNYEEQPKDIPNKKYLLLYFVSNKNPQFEIAKKIANDNNLDIIVLSNGKMKVDGCKVVSDASVGEFLYYIHNAELVITASFHGMIFSMNYNTNFMYFTKSNSASRLDNFADITNSKDRKLMDNHIPKLECDYNNINNAIDKLRKKSIEYLKTLI